MPKRLEGDSAAFKAWLAAVDLDMLYSMDCRNVCPESPPAGDTMHDTSELVFAYECHLQQEVCLSGAEYPF
jgi:hypothetical protein